MDPQIRHQLSPRLSPPSIICFHLAHFLLTPPPPVPSPILSHPVYPHCCLNGPSLFIIHARLWFYILLNRVISFTAAYKSNPYLMLNITFSVFPGLSVLLGSAF